MIDNERKIIEILSEEWAKQYQNEYRKGPSARRKLLSDPLEGLKFLLENAFARAGGEQAGYGTIAVKALERAIRTHGTYVKFMRLNNPGDIVWSEFKQICEKRGYGINRRLNEGVVKGLVKLAKIAKSLNFNPFKYLASKIESDTLSAFLILRNIRGIGDKIASFILRDMVTILDIEEKIDSQYQILLQPIDRWVHGIAIYLWSDLRGRAPSWAIALKIVTKCKEYGRSPARFNQGAWMYGSAVIKNTKKIPQCIKQLLHNAHYQR